MKEILEVQLFIDENVEQKIIIEYDNKSSNEAKYLRDKLIEHQEIFSDLLCGLNKISFIDSTDSTTLHISSLEGLKSYVKKRLPALRRKIVEDVPLTNSDDNITFLKALLINLYQELDIELESKTEVKLFEDQSPMIYEILAAHYYDDPSSYLEYLFGDPQTKKEEIFTWFNNKERFNLLNQLLKEQYQLLFQFDSKEEIRDPFLLKYLPDINDKLEKELVMIPLSSQENIDYPKLSKEKLHSLVLEFFESIDKTGEWAKKYQFYHNNQIVYGEKEEDNSIDWCNFFYEGKYVILAPLTGTITDFRDLIHEIAHLPSLENLNDNDFISPSLLEFPSIFLEFEALKFLEKKGYPKELLESLYLERNDWTVSNITEVLPLLRLLERNLKEPITIKTEEEYSLATIGNPKKYSIEDLLLISQYYPFTEKDICEKCDEYNDIFIQHPTTIYKTYPYTIGRYLAVEAMNKAKTDETVVSKVLSMIPTLKDENPETIIEKLSLETIDFSQTKPIKEGIDRNKTRLKI